MSIWFCSDQHLGHARIIELCHRPFSSVTEMNETIIKRHNTLVAPDDTVYFLGDVCMGQLADSLPLVAKMHGKKILITGNHDRPSPCYPHKTDEIRAEWGRKYSEYFSEIHTELALSLPNGGSVLLHHFPYADPGYTDHAYEGRFQSFQPKNNGDWLIHGHIHDTWMVKDKQINVGVDVWDFLPVPYESIMRLIGGNK